MEKDVSGSFAENGERFPWVEGEEPEASFSILTPAPSPYLSMHIRQPEVPALSTVGELGVIEGSFDFYLPGADLAL